MRLLVAAVLLFSLTRLYAQTPAERFRAAEQRWTLHRPDGLTWDDGTPDAAQALDEMWSAITAVANDYLLTHPTASPAQLQSHLEQVTPIKDARFGNGLSASVARLGEQLFAVSFTDFPASTVFVLRPQKNTPVAWRINEASAQGKDTDNLLRAWQSSNADDKCGDREPNSRYQTCGPLSAMVGALAPSSTGAPRFYVDAIYSKDAGAAMAKQLSIWEWEGSAPALLWIDRYLTHTEATRPLRVHGSSLSFGVQDDFETFWACMSCDGRQLLHPLQLTPTGVKDQGLTVLYPELDRVDALFIALAQRRPSEKLANIQVRKALSSDLQRVAAASAKIEPKMLSLGMLQDWSVTHGNGTDEKVCIVTDELGRLDFIFDPKPKPRGFFTLVTRSKDRSACPKKNAISRPYSSPD